MKIRVVVLSALFASFFAGPLASAAELSTPTPTPPPGQDGDKSGHSQDAPREGWYPVGKAPRDRDKDRDRHKGGGWSDGYRHEDENDPWDIDDPNQDSIFFLPTGRTLRRSQLALGFPGPGGVPDIQYGLSDWMQVGAGYTLVGFTPQARLGIIRGRRVDATLVGGAYLPVGGANPFTAQYLGGVISAGKDDFRVHLGYQFVQLWGEPWPDMRSVDGGLGMTAVELRIAPRAKFMFALLNFTQINGEEEEVEPFNAIAVMGGIRIYGKNLSADIGVIGGEVHNLKLARDEDYRDARGAMPMLTLRYQL